MAKEIISHSISGLTVGQRSKDGYVNATALAAVHREKTGQRKDVADWLRLKRTGETLDHLSSVTGIPVTGLYQIIQGGLPENQGTWIHPKLATRFAIWLSDEFGFAVECWVEEWMIGNQPIPVALPPADIRIVELHAALTGFGIDLTNPRIQQPIQDFVVDKILGASRALPAAESWLGVAEKAEQMGYSISLVTKYRSTLGRYVASCGLTSRKEKRLCNGTMREINLYLDCSDLEKSIAEFMDAKVLTTLQE